MLPLRILFVLVGAILGVFYPFVSIILKERGFSAEAVGLVMAASALGFTVAVPIWGHIADTVLGRSVTLRVACVASTVAVLGLLLPIPAFVLALLIVAYAVAESALAPLSDALALNALARSPRSYARVRLLASFGFAVASIAAGRLYDVTGFGPAPWLWAACAVAIVVVSFRVADVPIARLHASAGRVRSGGSFGLALRIQPRLRGLLIGLAFIHFGITAGFTFLALRLIGLGAPPSLVALSAGISAIAEIPAMALVPRIVARTGLRALLSASILLYAACFVSWAFLDVPALIVASRIVSGIAFAGIATASVLAIGQLLPMRLQATGQSLYQMVGFGIASIVANAVGGLIYGGSGPVPLFLGAAVLGVAGAAIVWSSTPARGEVPLMPELPGIIAAPPA